MEKLDSTWCNVTIPEGSMIANDIVAAIESEDFVKDFPELQQRIKEYWEIPADDLENRIEFLNEDIWERMNEIAPEGCYFGSHPGNGSDYGFWEVEEEFEDAAEHVDYIGQLIKEDNNE